MAEAPLRSQSVRTARVWRQSPPDGRFVVFRTFGNAVYAAPLSGDRTPRLLVDTPFMEDEVHVSPDGRWVAFDADESGRWEVDVAAFPAFTSKRQISSGGGVQPQWRADGRERRSPGRFRPQPPQRLHHPRAGRDR